MRGARRARARTRPRVDQVVLRYTTASPRAPEGDLGVRETRLRVRPVPELQQATGGGEVGREDPARPARRLERT